MLSHLQALKYLFPWEDHNSPFSLFSIMEDDRKSSSTYIFPLEQSFRKIIQYYYLFHIETLSMVLIALHCIVHDHRNRNLQHYLLTPMRKLGKLQKSDGSFGSLKSTALAIQALQATDPGGNHWNRTSAISYVKQQQNDNGSFGEDEVK